MAENTRTRLPGHPLMPFTNTAGGYLILWGLPFALGLMLLSLGYLPMDGDWFNSPLGLLTIFGGVIAGSVAWLALPGILRDQAARQRKKEHPAEPWYWDHPWDSRGANSGSRPAFRSFGVFLSLAAVLSTFHWLAFSSDDPIGVVLVFDLFALVILCGALYRLFQYFKYGNSRLHFARFPFRPGHSLEAGLEASRKLVSAPSIALTLRYLEEVTETHGTGKYRHSSRVLYCLHELKQDLNSTQFNPNSDADIPISIRLPPGEVANRLSGTPRRYWELEVKAERPGIDYVARFLIPVY